MWIKNEYERIFFKISKKIYILQEFVLIIPVYWGILGLLIEANIDLTFMKMIPADLVPLCEAGINAFHK